MRYSAAGRVEEALVEGISVADGVVSISWSGSGVDVAQSLDVRRVSSAIAVTVHGSQVVVDRELLGGWHVGQG